MNRLMITGRLTKDPEMRASNNGTFVTRFTVAVRRNKDEADFINVIAYKQLAEIVAQYTAKGSLVEVEARVRTGSYEKDGRRVYTTDFIADHVGFLSSKGSENNQPSDPFKDSKTIDIDDSDLPF